MMKLVYLQVASIGWNESMDGDLIAHGAVSHFRGACIETSKNRSVLRTVGVEDHQSRCCLDVVSVIGGLIRGR